MIIAVIIIFAVVIIGLVAKSVMESKIRREQEQKAAEERVVAKQKLHENELLKIAVDYTVKYIEQAKKEAAGVSLDSNTHDFFVAWIGKNSMSFSGGLKVGERPHVSPSDDWHYDEYSRWLHSLNSVYYTSYEDKGYSELSEYALVLFLEVFAEELAKHGCRWSESYYAYDRVGGDTLLIWDLTKEHPEKELNAFI